MLKKCEYLCKINIFLTETLCSVPAISLVLCLEWKEPYFCLQSIHQQMLVRLFSDSTDTNKLLEYSAITLCVSHCRLPWSSWAGHLQHCAEAGTNIYTTCKWSRKAWYLFQVNVGCHAIGEHQSLALTPTPSCQWHRGNMTSNSGRLFNACVTFAPFQKSLNGM